MSDNEHMADTNTKSSSNLPTGHIASTSNNSTTSIENGLESYEIVEAEKRKENEIVKLKLLKAEKRKKKRENKHNREHLQLRQEKVNIEKVEKMMCELKSLIKQLHPEMRKLPICSLKCCN